MVSGSMGACIRSAPTFLRMDHCCSTSLRTTMSARRMAMTCQHGPQSADLPMSQHSQCGGSEIRGTAAACLRVAMQFGSTMLSRIQHTILPTASGARKDRSGRKLMIHTPSPGCFAWSAMAGSSVRGGCRSKALPIDRPIGPAFWRKQVPAASGSWLRRYPFL